MLCQSPGFLLHAGEGWRGGEGGALALACLRISLSTSQAHLGGPQSPSAFSLACMDGSSLRALWQCLVSDVQQTVDKAPALFQDLRHTAAFVGFRVVLHNATGPGATWSSSLYPLLEVGERELRGRSMMKECKTSLLFFSLGPGFPYSF